MSPSTTPPDGGIAAGRWLEELLVARADRDAAMASHAGAVARGDHSGAGTALRQAAELAGVVDELLAGWGAASSRARAA